MTSLSCILPFEICMLENNQTALGIFNCQTDDTNTMIFVSKASCSGRNKILNVKMDI